MCRWMGPRFHDWIDYNGVAFSIELLERGRTFSDFLGFFSYLMQPELNIALGQYIFSNVLSGLSK